MMKKQTLIEEHQVRKFGDPGALAIEVEKMQAAFDIGKNSGLFIVPEVIEFHADRGELVMSRLQEFVPLRSLRGGSAKDLACYHTAGQSLATVHQQLSMCAESRIQLPSELNSNKHQCWIHGDYTKQNVGIAVHEGRETLAIIDWQLSSMYGGNATFGSACFDVAWFVSGIFMEPPHKQLGNWNMRRKAQHFLAGYFASTETAINMDEALEYSRELYTQRRKELFAHYSVARRVGLLPGLLHWAMLLNSGDFSAQPA